MTHHINHITDHPDIEALQVINPAITVGHIHNHPTYLPRHESCRSSSQSSGTRRKLHPKKNMRVKIEDPHTDYYSCDDHSSDSGEDFDPLN